MQGDFFKRSGISIFDDDGMLKREVYEIMDIVKSYNAALTTGHLSVQESIELCRQGCARGVRMILTHPEWDRTTVPIQAQAELASCGTWIEKCWYNVGEGCCTAAQMAQHIHIIGAQHCFLTTDRGQTGREFPVMAMNEFVSQLLEHAISEEMIQLMLQHNPKCVLGL